MTDLNKEREEFESDLAGHLIERDANGFYLNDEIQHYWEKYRLKAQIEELKTELEKAKAQAVPDTHIVVPKEPTREMQKAGIQSYLHQDSIKKKDGSSSVSFKLIYQAMVEASESGAEG
ncbi:hypothetical protein ACJOYH_05665 [Acinetobacter baumannii]